jgi:hypothetical protein
MRPATDNLVKRSYSEVVGDILTRLIGGVVNEPIIFDIKTDVYPLARPALSLRGITGQTNGAEQVDDESGNHAFQQDIDFEYDADLAAVVWLDGGTKPDQGSRFFVDYLLPDVDPPITDINVGSVARTLCEAVGREIATLYEEVNRAYRFGFVDLAEGKALELVVSILDVRRNTKDAAVGLLTFFRDPGVTGDIFIPSGAKVAAADGGAVFETTQQRTLQRGQPRIEAPIRATEDFTGEAGQVEAAAINEVVRPIAGIARITNFEPTFLGAADETDDELRRRAKAALYALGNATLPAIEAAIRSSFATTLEIWDPNGASARRTDLGTLTLLIEAEPERFPSLHAAVQSTRAAGVRAELIARYVFVTPKLVVEIAPGLNGAGKQQLAENVVSAVKELIRPLSSGDPLLASALLATVKAVEDVTGARIVDVATARSDVTAGAPETLVDAVVAFILGGAPTEETALRDAVDDLLFRQDAGAPGGGRIPDRSLILNESGSAQASDAEIEAAAFQIVAKIGDDAWWITLQMAPADIVLVEGSG